MTLSSELLDACSDLGVILGQGVQRPVGAGSHPVCCGDPLTCTYVYPPDGERVSVVVWVCRACGGTVVDDTQAARRYPVIGWRTGGDHDTNRAMARNAAPRAGRDT